jgi:hypothetical protein
VDALDLKIARSAAGLGSGTGVDGGRRDKEHQELGAEARLDSN